MSAIEKNESEILDSGSVNIPLCIVSAALQAAAKADNRMYLNGIYIHAIGQSLRIVGSDGVTMFIGESPVDVIPKWAETGLLLGRAWLAEAIAIVSKINKDAPKNIDYITVEYRKGKQVKLSDAYGIVEFTLPRVDMGYPNYEAAMEHHACLTNEVEPAQAATIDPKFIYAAANIGKTLNSKSMATYNGIDCKSLTVMYDSEYPCVLLIMAQEKATCINNASVKLLGASVKGTIAACRAHATRLRTSLNNATDQEKPALKNKLEAIIERINLLQQSIEPESMQAAA